MAGVAVFQLLLSAGAIPRHDRTYQFIMLLMTCQPPARERCLAAFSCFLLHSLARALTHPLALLVSRVRSSLLTHARSSQALGILMMFELNTGESAAIAQVTTVMYVCAIVTVPAAVAVFAVLVY